MGVVEFMMYIRGRSPFDNLDKIKKTPPKGIDHKRWVGMVQWYVTRMVLNDGMRL